MTDDFSDILDHPHYVSRTRQHMPQAARAAQFSAFAALTGYDEDIGEAARLTDVREDMSDMPFAIAAFALAATNASLQYHRFHNDTYAVALQDSTIEDENGKAKKNILRAGTTVRLLKHGSEGKIMVQTSDKTCEGWANSGHFMPV